MSTQMRSVPLAPGPVVSAATAPPATPHSGCPTDAVALGYQCTTGNARRLSWAYIWKAVPSCLSEDRHFTDAAARRAADNAGKSTEISTAMIAMTINNSASVKPRFWRPCHLIDVSPYDIASSGWIKGG